MSENPVHSLYHCFFYFFYSIVPKELAEIIAGQSASPLRKMMVTGRGLEERGTPFLFSRARSKSQELQADLSHLTHWEGGAANNPENHFQTVRTKR